MKENILNIIKQNSLTFDKLKGISGLEEEKLEFIIEELISERLIFLNTDNKYELITNKYLVGTLEKTAKGAAYIVVNGERILIPSTELKTALKNDLVVIEKTWNHIGTIKGILRRKNNKLVCEVKETGF